jgi:hypothetical protein
MSTTIMCGLFVIAFTFNNNQITWLWNDNKSIAFILIIITIVLATQWIKYQRLLKSAKRN